MVRAKLRRKTFYRSHSLAVSLPSVLSRRILFERPARAPPLGSQLCQHDGRRTAEACPQRGLAHRTGLGCARRRDGPAASGIFRRSGSRASAGNGNTRTRDHPPVSRSAGSSAGQGQPGVGRHRMFSGGRKSGAPRLVHFKFHRRHQTQSPCPGRTRRAKAPR